MGLPSTSLLSGTIAGWLYTARVRSPVGRANGSTLFGCDGCSKAGADRALTNAGAADGPAAERNCCDAGYIHGMCPPRGASACGVRGVARDEPPAIGSPPNACAQQAKPDVR